MSTWPPEHAMKRMDKILRDNPDEFVEFFALPDKRLGLLKDVRGMWRPVVVRTPPNYPDDNPWFWARRKKTPEITRGSGYSNVLEALVAVDLEAESERL